MNVLVDTNILTRIAEVGHTAHLTAAQAVKLLADNGDILNAASQNFYEFWVVATRPQANNGLGMTPQQANAEIDTLSTILTLLPDVPAIFDEWRRLVVAHDCKGKPAHDARLVAWMNVHGVRHILTFNGGDFARYAGITVLDPSQVQGTRPHPSGP